MKYFLYSLGIIVCIAIIPQAFAGPSYLYYYGPFSTPWGVGESCSSACSAAGGDLIFGNKCRNSGVWTGDLNCQSTTSCSGSSVEYVGLGNGNSGPGNSCAPSCNPGEIWDSSISSCRTECGACDTYNYQTEQCDEGSGVTNPVTGDQCEDCESMLWNDLGVCLPSGCAENELTHVNPNAGCQTLGGALVDSSSCVQSCEGLPECTNVTGKANYDPSFDYCGEAQNACNQAGGTYGAIGSDAGTRHVCLTNYSQTLPTCTAGSQYYFENRDGSYGFSCASATPPPGECDGTKYDCDGDGNVDDQDRDGVTDNGTNNQHNSGGGGTGGATGTDGTPVDPNNPWNDPLNPAAKGSGDCDPTSTNYAECTGMGSSGMTEDLADGSDSSIFNSIGLAGDTVATDIEASATTAMGDGDAGISGPTGLATDITNSIFTVNACSDLTWPIWGGASMTISCTKLQILRNVLYYAVAVYTIFSVFMIATAPVNSKV